MMLHNTRLASLSWYCPSATSRFDITHLKCPAGYRVRRMHASQQQQHVNRRVSSTDFGPYSVPATNCAGYVIPYPHYPPYYW